MNKKLFSFMLILLLVIGLCAGCQAPAADVEPAEEAEPVAEPVVMKIGHSHPPETARHQSLLEFKKMVEEETAGAVLVEIYDSGQLGSEAEMMEQVKMGTIQGTRGGSFEDAAPEILIYTMPFLFEDLEGIQKITLGEIGERIAENSKKNGVIILATGDAGGFRHISNNVRPITCPEDMKGLKLRTPPIESIIKTMEALGANPVSIPYGETYMALKQGVADGQENPYTNIASMKFYEVQKYLTVINYQFHPDPFFVSLDWYNTLTPEIQDILRQASIEMCKISDELMKQDSVNAYEVIKDHMEIYELSAEERQVFIDAVQPVYDYYIEQGLFTWEDIEEIRSTIE